MLCVPQAPSKPQRVPKKIRDPTHFFFIVCSLPSGFGYVLYPMVAVMSCFNSGLAIPVLQAAIVRGFPIVIVDHNGA
jgi:hypothetical protein